MQGLPYGVDGGRGMPEREQDTAVKQARQGHQVGVHLKGKDIGESGTGSGTARGEHKAASTFEHPPQRTWWARVGQTLPCGERGDAGSPHAGALAWCPIALCVTLHMQEAGRLGGHAAAYCTRAACDVHGGTPPTALPCRAPAAPRWHGAALPVATACHALLRPMRGELGQRGRSGLEDVAAAGPYGGAANAWLMPAHKRVRLLREWRANACGCSSGARCHAACLPCCPPASSRCRARSRHERYPWWSATWLFVSCCNCCRCCTRAGGTLPTRMQGYRLEYLCSDIVPAIRRRQLGLARPFRLHAGNGRHNLHPL